MYDFVLLQYRAMFERGTRAFVSFVQSYVKHECSLIFRVKGKVKGQGSGYGMSDINTLQLVNLV